MRFPIIEQDKNKFKVRYLVKYGPPALLITIAYIFENTEYFDIVCKITGVFYIIWLFFIIYFYNEYKTFKIIGFLEYKEDSLLFKDISIKKEDIEEIVINYKSYLGSGSGTGFIGAQGDDNEVVVLTKSGSQYKFYIYLGAFRKYKYIYFAISSYDFN